MYKSISTIVEIIPQISQEEKMNDHDQEDVETKDLNLVDDDFVAARRSYTYEEARRLKRRADWHLLPLLILHISSKI